MSFDIEGRQCQYCHAKLFNDDDVVVCPVCGALHHRDCFNSLGHCALEDIHGTDACAEALAKNEKTEAATDNAADGKNSKSQASNDRTAGGGFAVKCKNCGAEYEPGASFCPQCGAPNTERPDGFFFDFLGGVSPQEDLGEGVTAEEARDFVMANSNKYIPKFARIKSGRKVFFNLLAFLFPVPWLFSRKMYRVGALVAAVEVALTTVLLPCALKLQEIVYATSAITDTQAYMSAVSELFSAQNLLFLAVYFIGGSAIVALHILTGLFGDYLYRNHVISTLKEIKSEEADGEDFEDTVRKKGGVSLIMMILGYLITVYLPQLIAIFAGVQGV